DQRADERRLARAGQPHDDEDLARPHFERDVLDRNDAPRLLPQLGTREVRLGRADELLRVRSEDLPDTRRADRRRSRVVDAVLAVRGSGLGRLCHARAADISLAPGVVHPDVKASVRGVSAPPGTGTTLRSRATCFRGDTPRPCSSLMAEWARS